MYRISVITDGKEYAIHEPYGEDARAISPVISSQINTVGSLTFKMANSHPNVSKLLPLESEIRAYDNNELIFCGRMVKPAQDFYNTVEATCESELAYLIDSQQRPFEFTGTAQALLQQLLAVHNSQVEERKRFECGTVSVVAEETFVSEDYLTTLKTLKSILIDTCGGYLRIRRAADGKRYLDIVNDFGGINDQVIRFGENMLDINRYKDATQIVTCLIPTGADIDSGNSTKRVDITSVNGGLDYIEHASGVAQYGRIWGYKQFESVTEPEVLLTKARAYLEEAVAMPETMEIGAIDLGLIDVDARKLQLGYWTNVESIPHDISRRMFLTKKEIHLDDPQKDRITLGQTLPTFTSNTVKQQAQTTARIKKVASEASKEINRKVDNATQLITGGTGGYVVLDIQDPTTGEKMHPWRILIMDTPDKDTARHVIQFNQNGIGFSRTGIAGPYTNAWTIDGNLVADFITTGTMLADRIRGGTLELGGADIEKDGKIVVRSSSGAVIGTWDKYGITINQGVIDVGPLYVDSDIVEIGDFVVSTGGENFLSSQDGSIRIQTKAGGPLGSYCAFSLSTDSGTTTVTDHHIDTKNIILGRLRDEYGSEWSDVGKNIIELWNRLGIVESLLQI